MPSRYRYIHHVHVLRLTLFRAETFSIFPEKISAESGILVNSAAINNLVNTNILKGKERQKKRKEISARKGTLHAFKHFPWVDTPHGSECPVCALPFWAVILPFFLPCKYKPPCLKQCTITWRGRGEVR